MNPKAVTNALAALEETETGLREYILAQRPIFDSIQDKATDFAGWLAFKLTCNRRDAETIQRWASTPAAKPNGVCAKCREELTSMRGVLTAKDGALFHGRCWRNDK